MNVTEKTKFVANEILDYIHRYPDRHDQSSWFDGDADRAEVLATKNVCDSTMCIAGTAVFLTEPLEAFKMHARNSSTDNNLWSNKGQEVLGLSNEEGNSLFYSMSNTRALELLQAVADGDEKEFLRVAENTEDSDYGDYED